MKQYKRIEKTIKEIRRKENEKWKQKKRKKSLLKRKRKK